MPDWTLPYFSQWTLPYFSQRTLPAIDSWPKSRPWPYYFTIVSRHCPILVSGHCPILVSTLPYFSQRTLPYFSQRTQRQLAKKQWTLPAIRQVSYCIVVNCNFRYCRLSLPSIVVAAQMSASRVEIIATGGIIICVGRHQ
jgi:hypothetical protein